MPEQDKYKRVDIMIDDPLISIITPTYNRADLLPETIESILSQTYKNIEYIIVDDGSTDNTSEIVKPYLNDKRVKYFYHDNMGESKTTNRGYSLASGELTIVINSDDPLLEKDYLEKVVTAFNNNPDVLAVYPNWVNMDINSNVKNVVDVPQFDLISLLQNFNITLGPGMVIKREALKKIGFRDENIRYTGDLNISYKLARMGKLLHLDCYAASHRSHDGCAQYTGNHKEIAEEILNLNLMIFKDKRKNIPKIVFENKETILKKALVLHKCYSNESYEFVKLGLNYKSLFNNFFEEISLYFKFKSDPQCWILPENKKKSEAFVKYIISYIAIRFKIKK